MSVLNEVDAVLRSGQCLCLSSARRGRSASGLNQSPRKMVRVATPRRIGLCLPGRDGAVGRLYMVNTTRNSALPLIMRA